MTDEYVEPTLGRHTMADEYTRLDTLAQGAVPRASQDILDLEPLAFIERLARMTPKYGERSRHWELAVAWLEARGEGES